MEKKWRQKILEPLKPTTNPWGGEGESGEGESGEGESGEGKSGEGESGEGESGEGESGEGESGERERVVRFNTNTQSQEARHQIARTIMME